MWGISSQLLQQSAATAPYWLREYLLTAALPDLQRGMAPLGPPAPTQPDIKNTLERTNSRIMEAEDRISEIEDRMVEINESEREKRKTN